MKQGIVLLAHGSRDPEWSRPYERLAASVEKKLPAVAVALAYLEHGPSLDEAIAVLVAKGTGAIRIVPVFLGDGKEDLQRLVESAARPGIHVSLDKAIGEQPQVIEAIANAIAAAR